MIVLSDISPILNATWLKVKEPQSTPLLLHLCSLLDEGEAHAIALAIELKSDLLIIDEFEGRKVATHYQLKITGVIGILIQAKNKGFIPLVKPLLDSMISDAKFYLNKRLYNEILKSIEEY